jgi:OOP family OmpA-OmpF porin
MSNHVIKRHERVRAGAGLLACAAFLSGAACLAFAQDARPPSAAEIVRKLTPAAASPASGSAAEASQEPLQNTAAEPAQAPSRSIATRGIRVENRVARVQAPPSLDLAVNFEYASARLTPDARIVLDSLGQALNDPALRDSRMRIAGHTDAKGADAYNLALSRQRAQSVAEYLARQHGVDATRLSVEGFGRNQLLDPANPESAVNRRVQVVNLGKASDAATAPPSAQ